eukprot:m.751720 g.751720  ORF g.751720 m.751720 type:complete len:71 (-) comp23168_c0_seq22:258-470(-)
MICCCLCVGGMLDFPTGHSIFTLDSGYVQRGSHQLPQQGFVGPWKYYHSFWQDFWRYKTQPYDDGVLRFS